MPDKKVFLSVTNDVITDQRVHRIAVTLCEFGYDVEVVGRDLGVKFNFNQRPYKIKLLKLPFRKGFLFYAFYNLSLFFYLLFKKANILVSNDLDTLPANYLVSHIRGITLVFDSHEYFPEVPELIDRKFVKNFWIFIEKIFVKRVKYCYTVCDSIADLYKNKYNAHFEVIRNLPFRKTKERFDDERFKNKKIIIYQGALNIGRGIELMIEVVRNIENAVLIIAGKGDIEEKLKQLSSDLIASGKVVFLGRLPLEDLHKYTSMAHLGFSLEENMGINYYYALPNKLFDYIQAEVPVLVSDLPEMACIVKKYEIGMIVEDRSIVNVTRIVEEMLSNEQKINVWKNNLKKAAEELCWENEKFRLIKIYQQACDNE